jgi:hypothetical protein
VIRALALTALLVLACGSRVDPEAQRSAGRIAHAVEQLRNAPNASKATALGELGKLPCTGPDVCETRAACQTAYSQHIDALNLTAAAKLKLTEGDGAESAKLLGAAEEKLGQAARLVSLCTERESALRRRYKL